MGASMWCGPGGSLGSCDQEAGGLSGPSPACIARIARRCRKHGLQGPASASMPAYSSLLKLPFDGCMMGQCNYNSDAASAIIPASGSLFQV
mmetsp:Transcript_35009/g.81620  ORF Transcript_35009/g.81620 Transcript_35009/m.81620 type:complete len:91 (-) Transcript_35009:204-476(-)